MSDYKEHSVMGFPRACGKRRWPDDAEDELLQSPSKVVCTTAALRLCPENAHPTPALVLCSAITSESIECEITPLPVEGSNYNEDTLAGSDSDEPVNDHPQRDEDEEEDFIDDEEDKDSGFIDGNSIDNSSDDETESKGHSFSGSALSQEDALVTLKKEECEKAGESDLKLSLSQALLVSSSSSSEEDTQPPSTFGPPTSSSTEFSSALNGELFTSEPISLLQSSSLDLKRGETSITTVTAAQTSTIVTSAYQGSVSTPSFDLHPYQSTYTSDFYQPRPCTPSWSCTFYDGSQPSVTNRYMEISPNRSLTSQSIQCDENGKSYLELGSASPFPNTYSTDCGSFTASPSSPASYQSTSYSQSFSNVPYSPSSSYFNTRQNYGSSPSYNYSNGDQYNSFDGESGCSYGYITGPYLPTNAGRGPISRLQSQRCSSPICDPTQTSPRPACYQQQRLSVLNMSMFKLSRFSRFREPSLHHSVLICNTLRHIEKELEIEGVSMTALLAHSHSYGAQGQGIGVSASPAGVVNPDPLPSMDSSSVGLSNSEPLPSLHSPLIGSSLLAPPSSPPSICSPASSGHFTSVEHSVSYSSALQVTEPNPMNFEPRGDNLPPISSPQTITPVERPPLSTTEQMTDDESPGTQVATAQRVTSPSCEDRMESGINWCSVLSLSSQTDLDSMNNNECHEWNNEAETQSLTTITSRGDSFTTSRESSTRQFSSTSNEGDGTPQTWKLPSLSADDVLKTFPEAPPRRQEEELDSIIKVLVDS